MSEAPDPLEAELSALRPREVSPGLRRRIAERLGDPGCARRPVWRLALVGGLTAAGLAVVFFRWGGGHDPRPGSTSVVIQPPPAPTAEVGMDDSEPTLLAYERALARSAEDLNLLLGERATVDQEPARIGAFTPLDASLLNLLGED